MIWDERLNFTFLMQSQERRARSIRQLAIKSPASAEKCAKEEVALTC